ncbi:MAG TPA: glycosyltransferase, partial [Acidobacteriota bacterium]|nr:glycosyltransferase [Acidobacteriota bacterium]
EYAASSVLISPSASETYGMAVHEARAFGLPVLALRAPYSEPYIESGKGGLLFGSLAALVRGTLDLARRPERLRALAAAAENSRPADAYAWADAARSFLSQRRRYAIFRTMRR